MDEKIVRVDPFLVDEVATCSTNLYAMDGVLDTTYHNVLYSSIVPYVNVLVLLHNMMVFALGSSCVTPLVPVKMAYVAYFASDASSWCYDIMTLVGYAENITSYFVFYIVVDYYDIILDPYQNYG